MMLLYTATAAQSYAETAPKQYSATELSELKKKAKQYDYEALLQLTEACQGDNPQIAGDEAFELLSVAASMGVTKAQALLCGCYVKGIGTEKDLKKAQEWASIVRKSNDEEAIKILAQYQTAPKISSNVPQRQAPPSVSAPSHDNELANIIKALEQYAPNNSTQQLYRKRLLTLLPRILNGAHVDLTLPETKGNTALHYACGMGNLQLVRWLVRHGANTSALTNKGKLPWDCASGNVSAIRAALQESPGGAAVQHPPAAGRTAESDEMWRMGVNYQYAKRGYKQDYVQAVYWYRKAADMGHPIAQNNLGQMYNKGWGVEQNGSMAFYWWTRAAEQGHALAISNLGACYEFGIGVAVDMQKAIEYYRKAAALGNPSAKKHLERHHLNY